MILSAIAAKLKQREGRLQGPALRSNPDRTGGLLLPTLAAELP